MRTNLRPLHETNRDGHAALVRELGAVGAHRFLSQFTTGRGDYTLERGKLLGDATLEELMEEVEKEDRNRSTRETNVEWSRKLIDITAVARLLGLAPE